MNLEDSKQVIDQLNNSVSIECLDKSGSDKKILTKDKQRQQDEKLKRELEKKKKDLDREEDRKRKEIEKEEERRKKEEEKKKREEDRRLKQAEKDEEKKKRDEDKRQKDAEKEEKKRKEENLKKKPTTTILDFFQKKKDKIDQDTIEMCHNLHSVGIFKPIEIKKDMRIAAVERCSRPLIDCLAKLEKQNATYLDEIVSNNKALLAAIDTWPIFDPNCDSHESKIQKKQLTKTFLFNENVRPPFYGTWRKTSTIIGPLHPLSEDIAFFDYDVDSDQEWEYESGEDISNSEGEVEEEVNDDDDNSFVVPHGYLSDGEDCSDVDYEVDGEVGHVTVKSRKRSLSPKSRQEVIEIREKQFQAEIKQKLQKFDANIVGPYFIDMVNSEHCRVIMEPFRMISQNPDGMSINCNTQSEYDYSTTSTKMKGVPIDAVAHLIRLLHHNCLSRVKICYEFRMYWEYHLTGKLPDVTYENDLVGKDWDEFTIGKKRLITKIKEIAERKDGKWIVKPEVIHEYQLCCINDDPTKECTEQWKYVSNILKIEITKKIQKKSKIVDSETKIAVTKELKQSKKRKHPNNDLVPGNAGDQELNPTVILADDANEKLSAIKAKKRRIDLVVADAIDLTKDSI